MADLIECEVSIGEIFDAISELEGYEFTPNKEYFHNQSIQMMDENSQWCDVPALITKTDTKNIIRWSDNSTTECATNHWIRVQNDVCWKAFAFKTGDEIVRADGVVLICMENTLFDNTETFYDLQINTPSHLYQTSNGVVHHNTLIGQTIARMLDVPFVIADATSLTEAGYVGDDVESIIARLVQSANYDIRKAERGIVYIDEIDKKAKKESATGSRDISGEGVQQALLKIIEGADVRVPPVGGKKNGQSETITVNTRNILFIIGGAFVSLEDVVRKRINKGATGIGFHSDPKAKKEGNLTELFKQIESEDLISYGLIPELVGRIPVVAALEELTEEQLVSILTEPKNSITKQFRKLFSLENVDLEFTDEALVRIAKIAKEKKTGARGLRSIIEQKLIRVQYELNELQQAGCEKVIVDVAAIEGTSEPQKIYGTPKSE